MEAYAAAARHRKAKQQNIHCTMHSEHSFLRTLGYVHRSLAVDVDRAGVEDAVLLYGLSRLDEVSTHSCTTGYGDRQVHRYAVLVTRAHWHQAPINQTGKSFVANFAATVR